MYGEYIWGEDAEKETRIKEDKKFRRKKILKQKRKKRIAKKSKTPTLYNKEGLSSNQRWGR